MGRSEKRTAEIKDLCERGQWSNKVEFLLAVAGNIVGLGNIWRFPYLCFKNGGGAFLIPYTLFAVTCGVPLFILDICIGQYTKQSPIKFWGRLCPLAEGFGHASCVVSLYSCISYNILLAWALFYFIASLNSQLPWTTCDHIWNTVIPVEGHGGLKTAYPTRLIILQTCLVIVLNCVELTSNQSNMILNSTQGNHSISSVIEFWEKRVLSISHGIEMLGDLNWEICLCLLASWVMCFFCIWKGVKSTGKAVYFTATFPYVMLLLLLLRGLTLPGALTGIKYYLYPQVSLLTDSQVWIDAATQIFFSYSLATGSLAVLGSYNSYKTNCYRTSLWLCALNSCTSFIAGFVVFSVMGFMAEKLGVDIEDAAQPGPGLAFIAYPQAVAMMPLPQLWSAGFFIMLIFLGLDTQFVGLELLISSAVDVFPTVLRRPYRRELFVLFFCTACFCFQILMTTQGGVYIFHLIDFYGGSGACLLFMGLIETVIIGWIFGPDRMFDVIEDMCDKPPSAFFKYCWRYFTPLMCLGALIFYLAKHKPLTYNNVYVYPNWAYALGWLMVLISPVMVITWGLVKLYTHKGSLRQCIKTLCTPDDTLPLSPEQRAQLQINEMLMAGM